MEFIIINNYYSQGEGNQKKIHVLLQEALKKKVLCFMRKVYGDFTQRFRELPNDKPAF